MATRYKIHSVTNLLNGTSFRHSPYFGGFWEAGIRSTKHHLKRVLQNALLTFEELYSVITQIEAMLNSRPLCPLSSDPTDLIPLTPSHFLIGRPATSIADPDTTHLPESQLSQYQRLQQLCQHFWQRWHKEYISELQQRIKWQKTNGELKEGAMVLLKKEEPTQCTGNWGE